MEKPSREILGTQSTNKINDLELIAYKEAQRRIELCLQAGNLGTYLNLSGLGLNALPPEVGSLSYLARLHLNGNNLESLPTTICTLKKLRFLNIEQNYIESLPNEIGNLTSLAEIRGAKNLIKSLPEEIKHLSELLKLDVSANKLTELPAGLGSLSSLRDLQISNNSLEKIPHDIGMLSELRILNLSNNALEKLPSAIGRLAKLEVLQLSGNRLVSIPNDIGSLESLQILNLDNNSLQSLPLSLKNLSQLNELSLYGNKAFQMPVEILGTVRIRSRLNLRATNAKDVLDYYFSSRGDAGQKLREIKVLVVGRGGVGKTSLIRRLKGLKLDAQQSETHGISIDELALECADGRVSARVWDFGGQHVLHAMHEFFFTGRSVYILVLAEREDTAERDVEYWLQLIRSYAPNAPVIIVLNKAGRRARDLDLPRRRFENNYGPILAWLPTECSEDDLNASGILDLERTLTRVVSDMPEIQARFPKKWMQIKRWLSNMSESYLDYRTYSERCDKLGETDPKKQEELAAFLHDLGIALNYRRDPRLHETTVLRPDWLADGIYGLLRANDQRHERPLAPDGKILLEGMSAIYAAAEKLKMLKSVDYPIEKHPFLLRLMAAFQLSFPLDELGTTHLVPALLSVEEPSDMPSIEYSESFLNIRWEFPVIPGPLLPRLLVRTFGLISNNRIWRRGAFYEFGPSRAKIWEEKERFIYLRATIVNDEYGPVALADLVGMIKETLKELISEYKSLSVEEQVLWGEDWIPRRVLDSFESTDPDA